jgi:hypothetical protein
MAATGGGDSRLSRWSSLSSRLAVLIAILLVLSALVTAMYAAISARNSTAASSAEAMSNAHRSTSLLIAQAYEEQKVFQDTELAARKSRLEGLAKAQISAIEALRQASVRGEISEQNAKDVALKNLFDFRYDGENYFFTYTPEMVSLENPNPKFIGDMIDFKDANGKAFFRDFQEVALGAGSGFVDYVGTRLGSTTPSDKISYIEYYAPWKWVLGTGVYIDDIEQAAQTKFQETERSLGVALVDVTFSGDGFFFVLDAEGKPVITPANRDLTRMVMTDAGIALGQQLVAEAPDSENVVTHVDATADFNGTSESWSVDLSTYAPLGWTLVSAVPTESITAPAVATAWRQALLSLGVLALGLLIGLLTSRRIVRPVATMTRAALALEQDTFDPAMLDQAAARKDEVGTLARAFQRMGSEVIERERKLREQVQKLTVVIDRQKVQEQSEAIVSTDYFQSLTERANELRGRFGADSEKED